MYRIRKANQPPRWIELSGDCRRDLHAPKVGYNFTVRVAPGVPALSQIELAHPRPILTALGQLVEKHFKDTLITRQQGAIWNKSLVIMPDHLHFCIWVNARIKMTINQYFTKAMLFAEKDARQTFGLERLWNRPGDLFVCYSWETFQQKIAYNEANIARWKMDHQKRHLSHPHVLSPHPRLDAAYTWEGYGDTSLLDAADILPCYISSRAGEAEVARFTRLAIRLARAGWVLAGGFVSPQERALLRQVREKVAVKAIHVAATRLADEKMPAKLAKELYAGRFLRLTSAEQETNCTRALCVWHNLWVDALCGDWRARVQAYFVSQAVREQQLANLVRFLAGWGAPNPKRYYGPRALPR